MVLILRSNEVRLIFSMVKEPKEVTDEEKELIRGFTDVVGLAVQNSTIYTKLQTTSKKLKHANLRLKELDVLKNEFVSVASHELRMFAPSSQGRGSKRGLGLPLPYDAQRVNKGRGPGG